MSDAGTTSRPVTGPPSGQKPPENVTTIQLSRTVEWKIDNFHNHILDWAADLASDTVDIFQDCCSVQFSLKRRVLDRALDIFSYDLAIMRSSIGPSQFGEHLSKVHKIEEISCYSQSKRGYPYQKDYNLNISKDRLAMAEPILYHMTFPGASHMGRGDMIFRMELKQARMRDATDELHFVGKQHKMKAHLGGLLDSGTFSDFTIETNGGRLFKVHKNILIAKSQKFKEIFEADNQRNILKLPAMNSKIMGLFLRYMYTGELQLDEDNNGAPLMELFKLAEEYQVKCLREKCEHKLVRAFPEGFAVSINQPGRIVELLKSAVLLRIQKLRETIFQFVSEQKGSIVFWNLYQESIAQDAATGVLLLQAMTRGQGKRAYKSTPVGSTYKRARFAQMPVAPPTPSYDIVEIIDN